MIKHLWALTGRLQYELTANLVNGIKVRGEHVSVIVAHLSLNDRDNPLQSHSSIHILFREGLQLTTGLSGRWREKGGGIN